MGIGVGSAPRSVTPICVGDRSEELVPSLDAPQENAEMDEDKNRREGIPNDWYALWLGDEPMVVQQIVQADPALVESEGLGLHLVGG